MKNVIALIISVAGGLLAFWFIRGIMSGLRHLKWIIRFAGYRLVTNAVSIIICIVVVVALYHVLKKIL